MYDTHKHTQGCVWEREREERETQRFREREKEREVRQRISEYAPSICFEMYAERDRERGQRGGRGLGG